MRLPDGTLFRFWEDETEYTRAYHVACQHPEARDENPGDEERPFATIGRAAEVLQPGEKVIVHEGTYRECVRPARGGESAHRMIAYEAVPGELVRVLGSEVWTPQFRPSAGWQTWPVPPGVTLWMADLPAEWFVGYNPFSVANVPPEFWTFTREWTQEEAEQFLLKRGGIFLEGRPLKQVFRLSHLTTTEGAFWVEDPGLRIHLRLWEDANPNEKQFEVTTREQVFSPTARNLQWIRVSGFHLEHAADGIPPPQHALLSTNRGRHWIIEDNTVQWANAVGVDVGAQSWYAPEDEPSGHHVIRRNHISDCGICGLAGATGANHTLVEDNLIERVGGLQVERIWECAGLKFHICTGSLFRRNIFRHLRAACGMWLDVGNRNCRISGNVFADIASLQGALFIECTHDLNLVDNNVFWDVKDAGPGLGAGYGVKLDSCENIVLAHNLFGQTSDFAASVNWNQQARLVFGRIGMCRRNRVLNNVFVHCPKRIYLGQAADNAADGNLYDAAGDDASFCIRFPDPQVTLNLSGWQRYYDLDVHAAQASLEAVFDAETGRLDWSVDGAAPVCQPVTELELPAGPRPPGPFRLEEWKGNGEEWSVTFPRRERD